QISFRSIKGILASLWMSLNILVAISMPSYYFFPALLGYTLWGLSRAVIHGLLERLPEKDPLLEILGNESEEVRTVDYGEFTAMRSQEESIHHQPTKRERER
ncbi:MAG: hypothetical protein ABGX31_07390, partial [bacterium]